MFDYILINARKPAFFEKDSKSPAYLFDPSIPSCKGPALAGPMRKGVVYMEGNYGMIESAVALEKGIKTPRVAYVGDNYIEDSIAPAVLPRWTAITVVPELIGLTSVG